MPSNAQLLPSTYYSLNGGPILFSEYNWDFNGNGDDTEIYTLFQYYAMMRQEAKKEGNNFDPIRVNQQFHTRGQSDWNDGSTAIPILHVVGDQKKYSLCYTTPISVLARSGVWWHSVTRAGIPANIFEYHRVDPIFGPGDGTVPILSAERFSLYRSSNSEILKLEGGEEVGHMELLSLNQTVWRSINDFLLDGELNQLLSDDSEEDKLRLFSEPETETVSILIKGSGDVRVLNENGDENQKLTEIARLKVPGVAINYSSNSVLIDFAKQESIAVVNSSDNPSSEPMEIEVINRNDSGETEKIQRYRFEPSDLNWRLDSGGEGTSSLMFDTNGDGTYQESETIEPNQTIFGENVDTIPPEVSFSVNRNGPDINITIVVRDNSIVTPTVFYSVNDSEYEVYDAPFALQNGTTSILKAFGQDQSGNASGITEAHFLPDILLDPSPDDGVLVSWPLSDMLILEISDSLSGPWEQYDGPVDQESGWLKARVPTSSGSMYFRLRSISSQQP